LSPLGGGGKGGEDCVFGGAWGGGVEAIGFEEGEVLGGLLRRMDLIVVDRRVLRFFVAMLNKVMIVC
jgi:hypothetical protein